MKNNKLKFVYVDENYLNYLRKIDYHVPFSKNNINKIDSLKTYKFEKFYTGILLEVDNKYYVAPVTSNKKKFKYSMLIKDNKQILGSVRCDFMIPINENLIKDLKIKDFFDKGYTKRAALLSRELKLINSKREQLISLARKVYENQLRNNNKEIIDFKKLEKANSVYFIFKYMIKNYFNNDIDNIDIDISINNDLKIKYLNNHILIKSSDEGELEISFSDKKDNENLLFMDKIKYDKEI